MEDDEKHEPQYEPENSMDETEFEEQNIDWLTEKFMKRKDIQALWADFIYDEYNNQPQPDDREER